MVCPSSDGEASKAMKVKKSFMTIDGQIEGKSYRSVVERDAEWNSRLAVSSRTQEADVKLQVTLLLVLHALDTFRAAKRYRRCIP